MTDLDTFLRLVPPEARVWQTFDDKRFAGGCPRRKPGLARVLHGSFAAAEPILRRLNAPDVGAGVYITGNHTDGFGRCTQNITRITTVVADMDKGMPASFALPPTIVVETSSGKFQVWWILNDRDTLTSTEHGDTHGRLILEYAADHRASGVARVYRVPGFWHLKGDPFLVRMSGGTLRPIDKCTLLSAFPPISSAATPLFSARASLLPAGKLSGGDLDRFSDPLRAIPADDHSIWIAVGLALFAESCGSSAGLAMWTHGRPSHRSTGPANAPSAGQRSRRRRTNPPPAARSFGSPPGMVGAGHSVVPAAAPGNQPSIPDCADEPHHHGAGARYGSPPADHGPRVADHAASAIPAGRRTKLRPFPDGKPRSSANQNTLPRALSVDLCRTVGVPLAGVATWSARP
jgi:RepB DNA-primase from phage plasmid